MLRLILVFIIVALVVRAFIIAGSTIEQEKKKTINDSDGKSRKGVPKSVGEYVDYEDVKRKA